MKSWLRPDVRQQRTMIPERKEAHSTPIIPAYHLDRVSRLWHTKTVSEEIMAEKFSNS